MSELRLYTHEMLKNKTLALSELETMIDEYYDDIKTSDKQRELKDEEETQDDEETEDEETEDEETEDEE